MPNGCLVEDGTGPTLWEAGLISVSESDYNTAEHFSFTLPETSYYALNVEWDEEIFDTGSADVNAEQFAVAWSTVPTPTASAGGLMLLLALAGTRFTRRIGRAQG